ncbi:conserved hypothetical protein [Ricinus communis]|uniref:Uncharacterized protein n=1 Tax=Ricinus communis TaxID=3988 RepID=B9S0V2_RICCO|nr:conserved hypothetical protein [Ricinus communis]
MVDLMSPPWRMLQLAVDGLRMVQYVLFITVSRQRCLKEVRVVITTNRAPVPVLPGLPNLKSRQAILGSADFTQIHIDDTMEFQWKAIWST